MPAPSDHEPTDDPEMDYLAKWEGSCYPAHLWTPRFEKHEYFSGPVTFAGETAVFNILNDATLYDLSYACEQYWGHKNKDKDGNIITYDWARLKFLAPPPVGILKDPEHREYPLSRIFGEDGCLRNKKNASLRLMVPVASSVDQMRSAEQEFQRRRKIMEERRATSRTSWRRAAQRPDNSPFTFQGIQPLNTFPNPQRAMDFLLRLSNDVGIRHVMKKHEFTVGLLTEMDPAAYTEHSHEGTSRTLGLNRNQGQVIELRLRTDDNEGFRDYRTVRRTLCHELTHNVHGPHDHNFWELCHQLEREVDKADYNQTGRTLGDGAAYRSPPQTAPESDYTDLGGWTGGTFVLGNGARPATNGTLSASSSSRDANTPASRERAARAAEERRQRASEEQHQQTSNNEKDKERSR